jgi:hypothetical protein
MMVTQSAAPRAHCVLIVTYEYPPLGGGGGVIVQALAEELAKEIDVTVLTSGRAGLEETERRGRLEIVRVPVWMRRADATASLVSMLSFFPLSLRRGAALLRTRPFDLVHSSFAVPSGPSGLCLARRAGIPQCSRFRRRHLRPQQAPLASPDARPAPDRAMGRSGQ